MSGHSKWSKIKHQKGLDDAKRGQMFTKLAREIIIVVKQGGADPDGNFRLRLAIQKARDNNMPHDNIERAIKRGSGETEGAQFVEITFEGYGPAGAAVMVKATTDNRNRTVQDVRNIFNRSGGNMGESGCVAWLFDSKGIIRVNSEGRNIDELTLEAIDAGADDVIADPSQVEIYTKPTELEMVRKTLETKKIPVASAELALVPKTMVQLDDKAALQTLKLLDKLEELDEVQSVSSNVDFTDAVLAKYQMQA